MDALYFLYTDKERNVVKYNLTTKSHSIIKKSQSVNLMHYATISKTRIGKFYWIFGDIEDEFRCGEIRICIDSRFLAREARCRNRIFFSSVPSS